MRCNCIAQQFGTMLDSIKVPTIPAFARGRRSESRAASDPAERRDDSGNLL
jgi:hypothetical protein